jgi:transposase
MDSLKYVGLDVHQATISAAVLDAEGKLVMQCVLATRASAILDFLQGLRGTVHLTFEEGTHSAWLYDLLVRRVTRVVVCDPRKNALLKSGNKSDTVDARKLAELLRAGLVSPVYHGENSMMGIQQLGRSYTALTEDTTRVMARLKAVYRGRAIACAGKKLYGQQHRGEWLAQLGEPGLHRRAELLYQQLDVLQSLRREARQELILESRKHEAVKRLRTVPFLGPIRAALLIGKVQTPHRFRTKRQFWAYCGLALETRDGAPGYTSDVADFPRKESGGINPYVADGELRARLQRGIGGECVPNANVMQRFPVHLFKTDVSRRGVSARQSPGDERQREIRRLAGQG